MGIYSGVETRTISRTLNSSTKMGVLLNNLNYIDRKDIVRTTENNESVEQEDKEPLG